MDLLCTRLQVEITGRFSLQFDELVQHLKVTVGNGISLSLLLYRQSPTVSQSLILRDCLYLPEDIAFGSVD